MLTLQDINLIKRDTSLKQLHILLDSEQYGPRLTSAAPEDSAHDARLTYLRYKPGVNCLAGYEYRGDGETRFAYAKIFAEDQLDKREKFNLRSDKQASDDLVFSFFPNDGKLRSLAKLDGAEGEKQFIQRVLSDREDLWAGNIHPIRYKPERRFVSRLTVDGQDRAVIKMHTGNSYARLRNSNKAFKSRENLKLAKRIGHSDRHRVLAFEWLPGQLLSDSLRSGNLAPKTLIPVGIALAHIHEQRSDRLPANGPEMQSDHIQAVADQVAFLCPELASVLNKTAQQICTLLRDGAGAYAATHGDFYAKQILIQDNQVGVLDFDESAFDDPMSDLGNFLAHLERDQLRYNLSMNQVLDYRQAFLDGYGLSAQPVDSRRLALFFAANLFKLLPHPFRFREAGWPEQTARLLDRVQRIMLDVVNSKFQVSRQGLPVEAAPATSVFPEDQALPFLKAALDHEAALPAISDALQASLPDCAVDAITRATLRRHKPGRRCLIEYEVRLRDKAGAFKSIQVLGKSRRKKLDDATYDLVQQLWQGAFNHCSNHGIFVPEPLGTAPEFNMWLQRKIAGYTATGYLDEPAFPLMARDIAGALHKLNTHGPASKRIHAIQDELDILDTRLMLVAEQHPRWKARINEVLASCYDIAGQIPATTPGPIHRDFYPDNVLIASDGIYLLDLDLYSMGDAALDAGNFIGHVIEYSLRKHGDPYKLEACTQTFEDRFVELAGEHVRPAIHLYTTLTLARHIQISTLFDDRKYATEGILRCTEQRLKHHLIKLSTY